MEGIGSPSSNAPDLLDQEDLLSWLLLSDGLSFDPTTAGAMGQGSSNIGISPPIAEIDAGLTLAAVSYSSSSSSSSSLSKTLTAAGGEEEYYETDEDDDLDLDDPFGLDSFGAVAASQGMRSAGSSAAISDGAGGIGAGAGTKKRGRSTQPQLQRSKHATEAAAADGAAAKKRPRDEVRHLEERIKQLQEENSALRLHVLNVSQRTTEIQRHRHAMETEMAEKMNSSDSGSEQQLAGLVKKYSDIYSDYGQYRQKEVAFHLENLERLLVPTLVTKMSLWTLQQDQQFFSSKSPLWDSISKALDITQEQSERIQQGRQRIKALLGQLQESLNLLGELRDSIKKRHAHFDSQCGGLAQIATPKQTVQFLMWMEANKKELASLVPLWTTGAEKSDK